MLPIELLDMLYRPFASAKLVHYMLFHHTFYRFARASRAFLLVAVLFFLLKVKSVSAAGTDAASFLDIPVGAGPASLGGAYTALAENGYAPVWNPAGLGFVALTEVAAQHLSYLESIRYEFLSFVHPLGAASAFGISAQYLSSGDIPETDNFGASLGHFSSHYGAYSLALGHAFTERLSVGFSGRYIDAKISDINAHAFSGDVGTMYRVSSRLTLAAVAANMGSELHFLEASERLPLAFRVGAAFKPSNHWTLTTEGVGRRDGPAGGHFGVQWQALDLLALRAGYRTDTVKELSPLAGFATGAGIRVWGSEFAYAWSPFGALGDTHYFSLRVQFGHSQDTRRNLIQYQSIKTHRLSSAAEQQADLDEVLHLIAEPDLPAGRQAHAPLSAKSETSLEPLP